MAFKAVYILGHFYSSRLLPSFSKALQYQLSLSTSPLYPTFLSLSPFNPPSLVPLLSLKHCISPPLGEPLRPAGLLANITSVVIWIEVHIIEA